VAVAYLGSTTRHQLYSSSGESDEVEIYFDIV
jgi:hypothetical protein